MGKISSPHDRYFRSSMTDLRIAKDFFNHYLPEKIKDKIDLDSLQLCKESYINKQLKLDITDMLYSVNIEQQMGYIYLLIEHQSSVDLLMPFRMIKYSCDIMDHHIKQNNTTILPLIVPMVFYHGKKPYPANRDVIDLFGENKALAAEILFKPFQLIDIGQIPDEEIRKHQWSCIMEFVTKHIFARDILPHLQTFVDLLKIIVNSDGNDYAVKTLNYLYSTANINDEEAFVEVIKTGLPPDTGEALMTLAELHLERGRQQGMQQGSHNAKREIAIKLLKMGHSIASVAETTELSIQEVTTIQEAESTTPI